MAVKKGLCRDAVLDILRMRRGKPVELAELVELSGFDAIQIMEALEDLRAEGIINYNNKEIKNPLERPKDN